MNLNRIPYITLILVISTIIVSISASYTISGTMLGKVRITDLEPFGGYTIEHIKSLELWRLLVAQLIHVKQVHMFYNALSLLALGYLLERRLGSFYFLMVWFVSGTAGTFVSTFTVPAPWNLGTGGSQAILGLAACGLFLLCTGVSKSKALAFVLILTIAPAFILDLIYASNHLPKLGHVVSFLFGLLFAHFYARRSRIESSPSY